MSYSCLAAQEGIELHLLGWLDTSRNAEGLYSISRDILGKAYELVIESKRIGVSQALNRHVVS